MESTSSPSRRDVLAVAAVTVSLPMIQGALGGLRRANAAAPSTPASPAAPAAPAAGANTQAVAEKPGWFTTEIKPADVKVDEFTAVAGHPGVALSRTDKTVIAVTTKCTHKGCAIKPKAGAKILTCPCHGAQFNLDGSVAKAPAKDPLAMFAIRTNDKGLIEVDPGQTVKKDAKESSVTVA